MPKLVNHHTTVVSAMEMKNSHEIPFYGVLALCLMVSPSNFSLPSFPIAGNRPPCLLHFHLVQPPPALAGTTAGAPWLALSPDLSLDAMCSILRARYLVGALNQAAHSSRDSADTELSLQ